MQKFKIITEGGSEIEIELGTEIILDINGKEIRILIEETEN